MSSFGVRYRKLLISNMRKEIPAIIEDMEASPFTAKDRRKIQTRCNDLIEQWMFFKKADVLIAEEGASELTIELVELFAEYINLMPECHACQAV